MYTNQKNSNNSDLIGQIGEELFIKIASSLGYKVLTSSLTHNKYSKIDYQITKDKITKRVEVKGLKRINRWGPQNGKKIWIELQGIYGHKGWLYGDADLIAFQTDKDEFTVVDRKKLIKLMEKLVDIKGEIFNSEVEPNKRLYRLYRRKTSNRKDIFTLINTADLDEINPEKWREKSATTE